MRKKLIVTTLLLLSLSMAIAQPVTIQGENIKVREAMQKIQRNYGYSFSVASDVVNLDKMISLDKKDAPLAEVLETIFSGQNVTCNIVDKLIVVSRKVEQGQEEVQPVKTADRPADKVKQDKTEKKTEAEPQVPQKKPDTVVMVKQNQVAGVVKDEKGEPLPGAGVSSKDGKRGVIADLDGRFTMTLLPEDKTLSFSFIGYETKEVAVVGGTRIEVKLNPDTANGLDEAVVIGYGSVRKADLTGSVTNVNMGDIRDMPVTTVDAALQGRIAGADIMSTSGEPGATTTIRIRGTRSITASNEPLIVVDGVMDAVHDLNDVNPDDIESITVLKDASSTAIYGSRGSNGVILITTKATTASNPNTKPAIHFRSEIGVSQLPRKLDVMDATEFSIFRNMYQVNSSSTYDYSTPVSSLQTPDPAALGKGTDWVDLITRTAMFQSYTVSMDGRAGTSNYFASINYTDDQGIVRNSGDRKVIASFSVKNQFTKWLKVGYRLAFNWRSTDALLAAIGGTAWWNAAVYLSPLINPKDNFNPLYELGQPINTPTAMVDMNTNNAVRISYRNSFSADITFTPHLKWNNSLSHYSYQRHSYQFYPSTLPVKVEGQGADAYRSEGSQISLYAESMLHYDNDWMGVHHLDLTGGYIYNMYKTNEFGLYGYGYLIDANKWNNMGAIQDKSNLNPSSSFVQKTKMSFIARANYNYKQRYYLTLSGRFDGASNFAANNKWGFFPSAALKWNIAKEKFLRRAHDIDELSIKMSVGRTGNDALANYASLAAMTSTVNGYLFEGATPVAFYPSRLDSPDLTWEKTLQYNLALTGAFFNSRLSFTAEAYSSRTRDLLLSVRVPIQTGFSSRYANLGETTNKGLELSVDSRNIVRRKFSWTTRFTMSHNEQRVNDIGHADFVSVYNSPGNNPYMMYGYVKGYPLNSLWGFQYAGVWHNQDEIARNKRTHTYAGQTAVVEPGLPKYVDTNHDGVLNREDLCYLGNADPYIYGGLQNNFTFGRWKLGVYLTYSLGGKIYNYMELKMAGSRYTNQFRYMLDAWTPNNPDSDLPRAGYSYDSLLPSSFMVHDASYFRIQNVSIGYNVPIKRKFLREISFTLSGNNLYLWKNYNGFDPDVSTESGGSTIRRMDLGAYPKPRKVVLTVLIKY